MKENRKTYTRLSDDKAKEVIALYKLDNSKQNIAKICNDYNITKQTIFNLAKRDVAKDIEKSIIESKNDFTKKLDKLIDLTMDRLEEELTKGEKITLSQLSTTLGILYDKSRLEKNLSTNNSSINIKIEIEK